MSPCSAEPVSGVCFRWTTQGVLRLRQATTMLHGQGCSLVREAKMPTLPRMPPAYARHYSDIQGDVYEIEKAANSVIQGPKDVASCYDSGQQLANLADPLISPEGNTLASQAAASAAKLPKLGPRPSRVKRFLETIPIKNYAHDFHLWDMSADELWERYMFLPEPRCLALSRAALSLVLRELSRARPRTRTNEARYLAILDDMRREGVVLTLAEWSAAISFVGRSRKRPDERSLQTCIALWHEMEMSGLKADRGVFNNLLDVAVRACRYQAVDVLRTEMQQRGITPDRYTYCILITLAGHQHQGDEVRMLYREMVQVGEIVDIVVINSVMQGLIRAGEAEAAEHIYGRLRSMTLDALAVMDVSADPPDRGDVARSYTRQFQRRARENQEKLDQGLSLDEHDISPRFAIRHPYWLAPNHVTLGLLLQHHCTKTGDFGRVLELLDDRQQLSIPEDQALYQALFRGFSRFAGQSQAELGPAQDDAWTAVRLAHIFTSLVDVVQRQQHDSQTKVIPAWAQIRLTQGLTISILQAYGRLFRPYKIKGCYRTLEKLWLLQGGSKEHLSTNVKACYEEVMARRSLQGRSQAAGSAVDDEEDADLASLLESQESALEQMQMQDHDDKSRRGIHEV
ncbi:hypothetical protein BCR37DRAFT_379025 [Protomyces lactucae-debilis]|uniref:Pentatricopeptide repeat protein n=1 Tax=Protomyces lactucae-debilis TaxID=2754530 RepID=A0A1Y2FGK9_PROLT|nr:uncharacterized protein BCR37DRAFT_379025 [Protomyces lactucae-debilis]ORY83071.1 hypothetical protein BCR37DRAFT_379025 [Protomyces lactucae-debilis]